MGLNIDIGKLCAVPALVKCPHCGNMTRTSVDDFDIETPGCNPHRGIIVTTRMCDTCEEEYEVQFAVEMKGLPKTKKL